MRIYRLENKLDRVILLINDLTIEGNTRIQKYAFLASQLYKKELKQFGFYDDWEAYRYGPYSKTLAKELEYAVSEGLVATHDGNLDDSLRSRYTLTTKGRLRLRKISLEHQKLINNLYERFVRYQRTSLSTLLKDIYIAYPEYTVNSEIRNRVISD